MGQGGIRIASLAIALLAVAFHPPLSAARPYQTRGQCDGFPKVSLTTLPGTCVGLVGSRLGFARGLAEHEGWIYITDLGSRSPNRGRLLGVQLDRPSKPTVLLTRLDRPGSIVVGEDGFLHIAESGRILRVDPKSPDTAEPVVTGLPTDGLHNLPGLAVAQGGGLFVSLGSASDNCEDNKGRRRRWRSTPPASATRWRSRNCPTGCCSPPPTGATISTRPIRACPTRNCPTICC